MISQIWRLRTNLNKMALKTGRTLCSIIDNSALNCRILLKFGTEFDHVTAELRH